MGKPRGLIFGVGINDSDYVTNKRVDGKNIVCPFYRSWLSMFLRCYCQKNQENHPTYIGCSVATEWHSFMGFRGWMIGQEWEGKSLDKDILIMGNKIYSSGSCIFISRRLNNLLCDRALMRGDLPLGVSRYRKSYQSHVSKEGKPCGLGSFETPIQAHSAWQKAKSEIIEQAANEQTDERIKNALIQRVKQLRDDLANGRETIKL